MVGELCRASRGHDAEDGCACEVAVVDYHRAEGSEQQRNEGST